MTKRAACLVLLICAAAISAGAQTFTTLHVFDLTDGNQPYGVTQAANGVLYGTTITGGNLSLCYGNGCGTVFSITTDGTFAALDSFDQTQGYGPHGLSTSQAANGDFYGTVLAGGATTGLCLNGLGCGTIYKITHSGVLTVVYNFCSQDNCADGSGPTALIRATDGNFYGTTAYGGANCVATGGCGTVFKITLDGTLTTLYSFCSIGGCEDGYYPVAGVIQAIDGNFYGTTDSGGTNCATPADGCGTVFKITPSGVLTTLYSFCQQSGCPDGNEPGTLIQATNGELYGSTYIGGTAEAYCNSGCGTLFKITPDGAFTTLYSFDATDGSNPSAPPLQASDGNFYGTTCCSGVGGGGTIYKLSPSGALSTLHSFCFHANCSEPGSVPLGLVQDTNGDFYGATERVFIDGCTNDCGTIYSFSIGLKPFVETQLASGRVGASVTILGTNLAGATGVSFNGTEATIIANSGSAIETTVPAGATSGLITVTGDGSTLKSNKPFHVIQ